MTRHTCSSSLAREMEMTPAEQPMPDRLYETTLDFILKWFTIMALSEGVGLNSEQFTIKISTCASIFCSVPSSAPSKSAPALSYTGIGDCVQPFTPADGTEALNKCSKAAWSGDAAGLAAVGG